jgi:hypothetical protein
MLDVAILLANPWNDGVVEYWKTGYEKRKKVYYTNSVESTFFNDDNQSYQAIIVLNSIQNMCFEFPFL